MSDMLEIAGLTKLFPVRNAFGRKTGDVRAVDNVSFAIPKGKVYGLAGESGSGKSTIARMIMGLAKPTAGDILLDGHNITGETGTRAYGRKVQMVFQNPGSSLNPRRTVGQSIEVPLIGAWHAAQRAQAARRRTARNGAAADRFRAALSARTVGRPEAARRHRPRPRRGPASC